jgi:hypothetical protein
MDGSDTWPVEVRSEGEFTKYPLGSRHVVLWTSGGVVIDPPPAVE